MSSIPDSVECPDCGQSFDLKTQGGWCTNPDCGSYKWEPDSADKQEPEANESAPDREESGETEDVTENRVECPHCGETVPDKQFCLKCGDPLDADSEDDTETKPDTPTCPDCGEEVQEDWAACINCGADLDQSDQEEPSGQEKPTCPDCGEEVQEDWAACINCGAALADVEESAAEADDADDESGPTEPPGPETADTVDTASADVETADDTSTPDSLVLEAGSSEIKIEIGDMVGKKVRTAHVQAGGDEEEARYISREHALLEREGDDFYIVAKHRNGLEVNGEELPVDERKAISDGDQITFAGVATATVRLQ